MNFLKRWAGNLLLCVLGFAGAGAVATSLMYGFVYIGTHFGTRGVAISLVSLVLLLISFASTIAEG